MITSFPGGGYGTGVLVQLDGKVVVAGVAGDGIGSGLAVVRYLSDGALDPSFGENGIAIPSTGAGVSFPKVVIQPDGRLVAMGSVPGSGNGGIAVWRFTTDGQPDLTFGTGGSVTLNIAGTFQEVAVQPDGSIVVVGTCPFAGIDRLTVLRFLPNGDLDPGFGDDGVQYTVIGSVADGGNGIAVQPDGRIVAAGYSSDGSFGSWVAVRFLPDGSLDPSFGSNGVRTIALGGGYAADVLLQPDGRIILGGSNNGPSDVDLALVRLEADGSTDNTFHGDGVLMVDAGGNDAIGSVALQPDGKIIGAGSQDLALLRVTPDGEPDVTFGGDGLVMNPVPGNGWFGRDIALGTDGRILLTGFVDTELAVVRILNDPDIGMLEMGGPSIRFAELHPNPLGGRAILSFDLADAEALTCELLDTGGRLTRVLFDRRPWPGGDHRVVVDLSDLTGGAYLLTLRTSDTRQVIPFIKY